MRSCLVGICWLMLLARPASAEASWQIALFGFELINTSLEPTSADEEARLAMISGPPREDFAAREDFDFEVLDTTPLA